jgi:hypothetical protein
MTGLHALVAWLTAASTLAVFVAALPGAIGREVGRIWIDRAVLVQVVAAAVACLAGLAVAVIQGAPSDPLHFVYAAVVLALVPATRYAVHRMTGRRFAIWIAVAALIAMGALLRSFMTGR